MATVKWIGGTTAVAQIDNQQITGVDASGETWTFTITDETGGTYTGVTWTGSASYTIENGVDGLIAAWNADAYAASLATATKSGTDTIVLTAASTGVPFYEALAADGSGAGTKSTPTVNAGPNDWNTKANWDGVALPAASDDIILTGTNSILYGLDQGGTEYGSLVMQEGATLSLGSSSAPLEIDITNSAQVELNTSGTVYLDLTSASVSPVIKRTGAGDTSTGQAGLYLDGSVLGTVDLRAGVLRLDPTSTTTTLLIGSGASAMVPVGATVTTINNNGGLNNRVDVAVTTINNSSGTLTTGGSGAITTLNVDGGKVTSNSSGTITTCNADGGEVDFTGSQVSRTVTTLNARGGSVRYDSSVLTITNAIATTGKILVSAA